MRYRKIEEYISEKKHDVRQGINMFRLNDKMKEYQQNNKVHETVEEIFKEKY